MDRHADGVPPATPIQNVYPQYMYTYPYGYSATPNPPALLSNTPSAVFPGYPTHTAVPNPRAYISPVRPPLTQMRNTSNPRKRTANAGSSSGQSKRPKNETNTTLKDGARQWGDNDKARLFERVLGPDNDETFSKLKQFKTSTLKKITAELFPQKTVNSVTGLWDRSFRIYKNICAFESVTGGGGDGDEEVLDEKDSDSEQMRDYRKQLGRAKRAGKEVGTLKVEEIDKWYSNGWFALFDNRYHESPNVSQPVVRHSGGDISGDEDEIEADPLESEGHPEDLDQIYWPASPGRFGVTVDEEDVAGQDLFDLDGEPLKAMQSSASMDERNEETFDSPATEKKPAINTSSTSSASKPQSKSSKKTGGTSVMAASSELLSKQSGYLDERVAQNKLQLALLQEKENREAVQDEERLKLEKRRDEREDSLQRARQDMDRQRLDREAEQWEYEKKAQEKKHVMEKDKQRFDAAQAVLQMPNINDTVKEAANEALLKILRA
ncbi:hypothetical protein F5878DRAFT_647664 [Lentinula raphanica]|uniref:Uncharacterized protein n=1 Tax=Lentinula raphanica TaxID=153919 RepID=A0AA38U2X4_9AGAR|nr:hypothetical protein F5878DRAFT_647664 [Lentinula raphanica]